MYSYLDATTGEWKSIENGKSPVVISHPWAEEEESGESIRLERCTLTYMEIG